jgi:hypothetical protein
MERCVEDGDVREVGEVLACLSIPASAGALWSGTSDSAASIVESSSIFGMTNRTNYESLFPRPGRLAGRLLSPSKEALMHSVAIIARLKTGAEQQATELLAQGPPFDPDEIGLQRHVAYVCGDEVVFVFEGPEVEGVVDDLVGYPFGSRIRAAFDKWRPLIEELPRVARPAYEWEREAK